MIRKAHRLANIDRRLDKLQAQREQHDRPGRTALLKAPQR